MADRSAEIWDKGFQRELLRSESVLATGVFWVVAFFALMVALRPVIGSVVGHGHPDESMRGPVLPLEIVLAGLLVHEGFMLMRVRRAASAGRELPTGVWVFNVFMETAAPTIVLIILTHSKYLGPQRAMLSPAALTYFPIIVLSSLRLRPGLSQLTGAAACAGYMWVFVYTYFRFAPVGSGEEMFTEPMFGLNAAGFGVILLVSGFAAGAVAGQFRRYVVAALQRVEAQREVNVLRHDVEIARSIQRGLLPQGAPTLEGYEIAGWTQPADRTGGDYFDWQELDNGRMAVSLADVSGHGIGPALVTAVCRAYARASLPNGENLAELISKINRLLVEDLPINRFVTFVAAFLKAGEDRVQLVSAGHGPILLYEASSGNLRDVKAQGIPLGILVESAYEPVESLIMKTGDVLVMLTDGFSEWHNSKGEIFGEEKLREAIRKNHKLGAREIIAKMYGDVVKFADGAPQLDDVTAVVVKRV